jgi:hypothetical protein
MKEDRDLIVSEIGSSGKLTKKQIYNFFLSNAGNVKSFKLQAAKGEGLKSLLKTVVDRLK